MLLAIKIDVDTVAAARDNVPRLVELLQAVEADATFFFNMGPDRSGRAGGKLFQVGESGGQQRRNWRHAKPRGASRFYGTLLPTPLCVKRAQQTMRAVQQVGYETGIRGWDWVDWVKQSAQADEAWMKGELVSACAAYEQVFGQRPKAIALPAWRAHRGAFRLQQRLELEYGSDTRGTHPFLPVIEGEPVCVPQFPTTLPTLAELSSRDKALDNAVETLLAQTAARSHYAHVFSINAHADGGKRLPQLQQLFAGWREQGYQLGSLRGLYQSLDVTKLPWHTVVQREWPGYAGKLASQGEKFPF
ncbi:MAG: polysaccharide deacetylase family protein [Burkholderiales bacterium]|nr:polysaccharide deacetylase family protein [Burkholderiales bacterium]